MGLNTTMRFGAMTGPVEIRAFCVALRWYSRHLNRTVDLTDAVQLDLERLAKEVEKRHRIKRYYFNKGMNTGGGPG
jgi:hypothetical protein